jgi:hypothetical protein
VTLARRLLIGSGALALALATVIVMGAGPAQAQGSRDPTGVITCTKIKGTVTFRPPLTNTGTAPEASAVVKLTIKDCHDQMGATVIPVRGKVDTNMATSATTNTCAWWVDPPGPATVIFTWHLLPSSTSTFSTWSGTVGSKIGLTLPNVGGTGDTVNSYAEGSGTTMTAVSPTTEAQFETACVRGLKKIDFTSGSVTL